MSRKAPKSGMTPKINEKKSLDLVMGLLPIPGISGKEAKVVAHIRQVLLNAGVPKSAIKVDQANKKSPLGGDTGNLICTFPGTTKGPRRMLSGHVDTVPICEGTRPVKKGQFVVSRDKTTGLGADNRSGAAAILNAAVEIMKQGLPHPPLTFMWPIQEEVGLFGVRHANKAMLGNPKLCFNWDGREPNGIIVGATGAYRVEILLEGIASHAGVHPEHGVSAITMASLAVAELEKGGWHGLVKKGRKSGTSNVGVIHAGSATNVITPEAQIRAEVRSHDSVFRKQILEKFRSVFQRASQQVKTISGETGKVSFKEKLDYESFRLDSKSKIVATARQAIVSVGLEPFEKVANGGLDANWLNARGMPCATFGSGQQHIHTVNERLILKDFYTGCQIALTVATS